MKVLPVKWSMSLSNIFWGWVRATPRNHFDGDVMNYPTTNTLCVAEDEESTPTAFLPFHAGMILESVALNPANAHRDTMVAFKLLGEAAEKIARATGIREIYFRCDDPGLALSAKNLGWEPVQALVLRKKVSNEDLPYPSN